MNIAFLFWDNFKLIEELKKIIQRSYELSRLGKPKDT